MYVKWSNCSEGYLQSTFSSTGQILSIELILWHVKRQECLLFIFPLFQSLSHRKNTFRFSRKIKYHFDTYLHIYIFTQLKSSSTKSKVMVKFLKISGSTQGRGRFQMFLMSKHWLMYQGSIIYSRLSRCCTPRGSCNVKTSRGK